jgi:hypothetical protein
MRFFIKNSPDITENSEANAITNRINSMKSNSGYRKISPIPAINVVMLYYAGKMQYNDRMRK